MGHNFSNKDEQCKRVCKHLKWENLIWLPLQIEGKKSHLFAKKNVGARYTHQPSKKKKEDMIIANAFGLEKLFSLPHEKSHDERMNNRSR